MIRFLVRLACARCTTPRAAFTGLGLSALAACGGSGAGSTQPAAAPPPAPPTTAATVNATPSISFSPPQVNLVQGGTVTFAFGGVAHNVYFDNDPAGAPANIPGANADTNVDRVFTAPGVYAFNCHIHPGMHGTVTVVSPDE